MGRSNLVVFAVEVVEEKFGETHRKWLTAERTWTTDRQESVEFQRARVPTARQQIAIEHACQDIAGGFKKWLELSTAEADLWSRLLADYMAAIWPPAPSAPGVPGSGNSRPMPKTQEEADAQWRSIEQMFHDDRSPIAGGYREMRRLASRIRFMAQWQVLVIQPPDGWKVLADLPDDPPGLVELLQANYDRALQELEKTEGNS